MKTIKKPPRFARSPALWLAIVAPLIVGGFVAAHVLIVRAGRNLHLQAEAIERSAQRRTLISTIRGNLHRLGMNVGRADHGEPFDAAAATAIEQSMYAELRYLRPLASAPGEAELLAEVQRLVEEACHALDRTLLATGAARGTPAPPSQPFIERADAAIMRLIEFEAFDMQLESARVIATDRNIKRMAPILDGIAAGFALVLMGLVIGATRQYTRLSNERNQLAETRAAELELFAGRVAHDLKNPLNAVNLRIQLEKPRFDVDEVGRTAFVKLCSSVARMNPIIEGLLEFARSGGKPSPGVSGELHTFLTELLVDFAADAERAGVTLTVAPLLPVRVQCSAGPLSCIVGNLVRNALKFIAEGPTPARRIDLRATVRDSVARIEVADTGPGIPAGLEQAIFEPFVRAGTGTQPGIGLGLATVKRLVEAYGGHVGVISGPGGGSCFWFELPVVTV